MDNYSRLRSDNPKVQEARQRAGRIVRAMNDLAQLVQEAWDNQDHKTLGYTSWQEYTVAEFGHGDTAVKARQIIVGMLRGTKISQRAIAAQVGTSVATVNNDLADLTPTPPDGDPATVDRREPTVQPVEQPARVTGRDGRTQPSTRGGMTGDERRARRQASRRTASERARDQAASAQTQVTEIDARLAEVITSTTPEQIATTMTQDDYQILVAVRVYGGGTVEEACRALEAYSGTFALSGDREVEIIAARVVESLGD